jgi:hypothetical protein
MELNLTSSL